MRGDLIRARKEGVMTPYVWGCRCHVSALEIAEQILGGDQMFAESNIPSMLHFENSFASIWARASQIGRVNGFMPRGVHITITFCVLMCLRIAYLLEYLIGILHTNIV